MPFRVAQPGCRAAIQDRCIVVERDDPNEVMTSLPQRCISVPLKQFGDAFDYRISNTVHGAGTINDDGDIGVGRGGDIICSRTGKHVD
jgi:hypothetical protein